MNRLMPLFLSLTLMPAGTGCSAGNTTVESVSAENTIGGSTDTADTDAATDKTGTTETTEITEMTETTETTETTDKTETAETTDKTESQDTMAAENTIAVTIDGTVFTAELYDSPAAEEFYDLLPLTLDMSDFNNNEKSYRTGTRFTGDEIRPEAIKSGDLMIYSKSYIVLFYEDVTPGYDYIPLGRVEEEFAGQLAEIVGDGSVIVSFERG